LEIKVKAEKIAYVLNTKAFGIFFADPDSLCSFFSLLLHKLINLFMCSSFHVSRYAFVIRRN